jgi:hypothetical protein
MVSHRGDFEGRNASGVFPPPEFRLCARLWPTSGEPTARVSSKLFERDGADTEGWFGGHMRSCLRVRSGERFSPQDPNRRLFDRGYVAVNDVWSRIIGALKVAAGGWALAALEPKIVLFNPRIDDVDAATLKVFRIASRQGGPMRTSDRSDGRVKLADRSARCPS